MVFAITVSLDIAGDLTFPHNLRRVIKLPSTVVMRPPEKGWKRMKEKNTSLASPQSFAAFGELLRYLRRRAGLTQREFALEVGYSEPQISYLEKNHRLPDVTTVRARFIPALDLEYDSPLARRLIQLAEASRVEGQLNMEAPYKGLQFFDVQDADLFYGRELLTARLVRHLRKHQFLAIVVGASGSGKSSIVRAGLIPALQRGQRLADGSLPPPGSAHWKYYVITPGVNPLESLIAALEENEPGARALSKSIKGFTADETSLNRKAKEILQSGKSNRNHHILLIVDQFEELFTLCEDEKIRRAFIDNLMYSASPESGGLISVVITLRADFYAHCAQYPNLRDALAHYQEYIGPMSREEIRRAIEQPALHAGLNFEPGLVDFILKEVGDEPGALPLLSHALLETWKRRQNQILTFRGFNQSGGIRGAIARTAEDVYLKLSDEQQTLARRIFLSLTELGQTSEEGLLTPDTRRRVKLNELIPSGKETKPVEGLLKLLSDARLVIVTEDSVEVAHEALIREWPRLREWLTEDRENLLLHRQLDAAASRWDSDGRKSEDLYRGSRLSQALEWAEKYPDELSALEKTFLNASKAFAEREAAKREAQRRKELRAAKKLAESESRRAEEQRLTSRRLRQRAWILSALLVLAGILAIAAFGLSRQRDEAAKLATSRELASASVSNLEVDPERSILLALEALSVTHTREAEEALHRAVSASRVEMTLRGHEGVVGVAVYSPDGSRIATAGEDGDIRLWDSASGENLLTLSGHEGPVYEVIFSPGGNQIASAGEDGTARIWDSGNGQLMMTLQHDVPVVGISFSPDEKRLATGGVDGSVFLWDLASGAQLHRLFGHDDVVISATFSPDGKQLVTSGYDVKLIFWDVENGQMNRTWEGEFGDLVFSSDGKRLAAGSSQGGMIMDAAGGGELVKTGGHTNLVFTAAINPDWTRIVTAGLDRKAIVSDAETGRNLFTLSGHSSEILDVHFSPDGKYLVTAGADGTARVWNVGPARETLTIETVESHGRISFNSDETAIAAGDLDSVKVWNISDGHERFSFETPAFATGVAFDPTGLRLAGATEEGDVAIWNVQSGELEWKIKGSDRLIMFIAFSPDGRKVAGGGEENRVLVWDSSSGNLLLSLEGHREPVTSVAFSPDGKRLASSGVDNIAIIWDADTGRRLLTLSGHLDVVWGVAFNPDGSRIATGSRDGTARIWDAENGEEILKLTGHTSTVTSVFFSPDGKRLATASRDGFAKIWDAYSGELLLTLYGSGEGINGVAFSPDGKFLATGGGEFLRVYLTQLDDLVTLAKSRVTRSLTEEECLQYLHMSCPADVP
jgi:WD40 repeat protein/transcriptional regulator with XRE-family HTH domain